MDITNYRKYIVNCPYSTNRLNEEPWEQVYMIVPPYMRFTRRALFEQNQNHPLVNAGEAYWSTNSTLCVGYRLRTNSTIFKPVFNYVRQRKINLFQKNIKRVVQKRNEKRAFIELFKLKQIPRVLIEKIIKLAY